MQRSRTRREEGLWAGGGKMGSSRDHPYLLFIDLLNTSHSLGQLFLFPCEDYLCLVNAGRRNVDACPCLLHELTHQLVVRASNEGMVHFLHIQPLHGTLILEESRTVLSGNCCQYYHLCHIQLNSQCCLAWHSSPSTLSSSQALSLSIYKQCCSKFMIFTSVISCLISAALKIVI